VATVTELTGLGAATIAGMVASGEVSRVEVARAHLERAEAEDGRIGAFSARRDPEAVLAEAARADARPTNPAALPLDGVPVIVKEALDVVGLPSTEGVRARAGNLADADSLAVARLREAGALILGKGKQPDFKSRWNTVSELHGMTRNPRDLSRSAGGSSGGDAAAVAAGFAAGGLGSDYGGSIRVPAAFCGVAGLRTSPGVIPDLDGEGRSSASPTAAAMSSLGPISHSVGDLRLLLSVLSAGAADGGVRPDGAPRRVARLCGELGAAVDPELVERLDATCDALREAGYEVVEARIPGGARLPDLFGELVGTELLTSALPSLGAEIGSEARRYLETMFGPRRLDRDDLAAAEAELSAVSPQVAAWMDECPLVVSPIAGMEAPRLDFDLGLSPAAAGRLFDRMRNAVWVNLLGLPALGLPNGIQVVGRRGGEREVLDAAAAIERKLPPPTVRAAAQPTDIWKVEDR